MNRKIILLPAILSVLAIFIAMAAPSEPAPADFIRWSPTRKLSWSDFKGQPERYSDMKAMTHSGIDFGYDCGRGEFKVDIQASFDPNKSWHKKGTDDRILAHEQLHFDITELCARRMRKAFADLENPCRIGNGQIMRIAQTHMRSWQEMEQQYDTETRHSLYRDKQQEWENKVHAELQELVAFAN